MAEPVTQLETPDRAEVTAARLRLQANYEAAILKTLESFWKKKEHIPADEQGLPYVVARNVKRILPSQLPIDAKDEEESTKQLKVERAERSLFSFRFGGGEEHHIANPLNRARSQERIMEDMRRDKIHGAWKDLVGLIDGLKADLVSPNPEHRLNKLGARCRKMKEALELLEKMDAFMGYAQAEERWSQVVGIGGASRVMEMVPYLGDRITFYHALQDARQLYAHVQEMVEKSEKPLQHAIALTGAAGLMEALSEIGYNRSDRERTRYEQGGNDVAISETLRTMADRVAEKGDALGKLTVSEKKRYGEALAGTIYIATGEMIRNGRDEEVFDLATQQWYHLRAVQLDEALEVFRKIQEQPRLPGAVKIAVANCSTELHRAHYILSSHQVPVDISGLRKTFSELEKAFEAAEWRLNINLPGPAGEGINWLTNKKQLNLLKDALGAAGEVISDLDHDRLQCRQSIAQAEIAVVDKTRTQLKALMHALEVRGGDDIQIEDAQGNEISAKLLLKTVIEEADAISFDTPAFAQKAKAACQGMLKGVSGRVKERIENAEGWKGPNGLNAAVEKLQTLVDGFDRQLKVNVNDIAEAMKEVEEKARLLAKQLESMSLPVVGGAPVRTHFQLFNFHFGESKSAAALRQFADDMSVTRKEMANAVAGGEGSEVTLDARFEGYDASTRHLIESALHVTDEIESATRRDTADRGIFEQAKEANEQVQQTQEALDKTQPMFKK